MALTVIKQTVNAVNERAVPNFKITSYIKFYFFNHLIYNGAAVNGVNDAKRRKNGDDGEKCRNFFVNS